MTYVGETTMSYRLVRRLDLAGFTPRGIVLVATIWILIVLAALIAESPTVRIAAAIGAVSLYPIYEWLIWRSWRRVRPIADAPWRYEVGSSIVVITPQTRAEVVLSHVAKVVTTRHAWMLTTAGNRARIPIPRAAFSPEDARAIDALVADLRSGIASAR